MKEKYPKSTNTYPPPNKSSLYAFHLILFTSSHLISIHLFCFRVSLSKLFITRCCPSSISEEVSIKSVLLLTFVLSPFRSGLYTTSILTADPQ